MMERVQFSCKNIPNETIDEIVTILEEKCDSPWHNPNMRKTVLLENLISRAYVQNPRQSFCECRQSIQPFCPEYRLMDSVINQMAVGIRLTERNIRMELDDWAYEIAGLIYKGMSGDAAALTSAKRKMERPYNPKYQKKHISQDRIILFSLFEYVPELKKHDIYNRIVFIGTKYVTILLNKIVNSLLSDRDAAAFVDITENMEDLKREVFLARNELAEYKALVEAEEAEYDDKIRELTQLEISSFFSALNNEKYGFLIDTTYLLSRACSDLKRNKTELPYQVQGIPAMLDRLMRFFKDAGIAPVSKFAPHSEQQLTLGQMDGCKFEPSEKRKRNIGENEIVTVKVLSSGWKYGDAIISYPVLHEIDKN